MTLKNIVFESLYFNGAAFLLATGIILKLAAPLGIGLFLIYFGRYKVSSGNTNQENSVVFSKIDMVWDLLFLGISSIVFFSLIKVILNIYFSDNTLVWNQMILPVSAFEIIYFEIIFRISLQKKNRFGAIIMIILFITSAGAFILDGYWLKTDLLLGFLSLSVTVILSFRKAYSKLINILS
ncbi:MAG: hypothetical protein U9N32_09425 [Spirochaetota bacterium]|nr:hypothetical protein [Spirochaetota bacterium]